jgi:hypothetical protein
MLMVDSQAILVLVDNLEILSRAQPMARYDRLINIYTQLIRK